MGRPEEGKDAAGWIEQVDPAQIPDLEHDLAGSQEQHAGEDHRALAPIQKHEADQQVHAGQTEHRHHHPGMAEDRQRIDAHAARPPGKQELPEVDQVRRRQTLVKPQVGED